MADQSDNATDLELADLACGGDREAYGRLVDRHLREVYAVARRILVNAADAEDVAQDAFVRAYRKLDTFDRRHAFRSWLLKIAANLAINALRSRQRERRIKLRLIREGTGESVPVQGPEVPAPSEWAWWLGQLEARQRTAIVLFHFHHMPYEQVAGVMGIPVNTVRTYLHRGRRQLRRLMTGCRPPEAGTWNVTMPNV